jgi:cyclopropane-fatty-acyl-phospholipid synthase
MFLLAKLLRSFIKRGTLRVIDAGDTTHVFGQGAPEVTIKLHDRALPLRIVLNPDLHTAEAFMDGMLTIENGATIHDFLYLFSLNRGTFHAQKSAQLRRRLFRSLRRWQQANPVGVAAKNARHHYDLSTALYRLFLDDDMQYSCGYFRDPARDTLEEAQRNKLIHATTKLALEPGMRVCEIGSGWGGFAIHLARAGAQVTAINVSPEQIKIARERAAAAGVADKVEFVEVDYRELTGQFDRVVSVGMMEHVGIGHLQEYFLKVRELLTPDGFAFIHSIGRMSPPSSTGPFVRKYIFPGGYVPAMSETLAAVERCGLWTCDIEVLRLHYAHTLRHWRERFTKNRDQAKAIYDERFCRMWEFYLSVAELEFLNGSHMVFQLLLAPKRDAVPLMRDYMFDAERAALGQGPR